MVEIIREARKKEPKKRDLLCFFFYFNHPVGFMIRELSHCKIRVILNKMKYNYTVVLVRAASKIIGGLIFLKMENIWNYKRFIC